MNNTDCLYKVDKKKVHFTSQNIYKFGEKKNLSNYRTDICYNKKWYKKGYSVYKNVFTTNEFFTLKKNITLSIKKILKKKKN